MHFSHGNIFLQFSSVQFSRSVMSDSLRPHESQHARPPRPSPGVQSDSNYVNVLKKKKKSTYLLGNLPFFKILVNCFMARHGSACANAVSK